MTHAVTPAAALTLDLFITPRYCAQVELEVGGVIGCESYPSPLPDLFTGLPLLVSGRFTGAWPASVVLRGLLPDGKRYSQKVQPSCCVMCWCDLGTGRASALSSRHHHFETN